MINIYIFIITGDSYIKDINTNNPLCSGGKVVKAFADVIKALWSQRRYAFKPLELKVSHFMNYFFFIN